MARTLTLALLMAAVGLAGCSNKKGGTIQPGQHSTYPHHYHDKRGNPHLKPGSPPPPPHNHHHGPTWK